MTADTTELIAAARYALAANDWARVSECAMQIARQAPKSADAPFLMGLVKKTARSPDLAADYFSKALSLNSQRYDAAVELASQKILLGRYGDARELLDRYREALSENAHYLGMAGTSYFGMNLYEDAWPLLEAAAGLKPDVEAFQVQLASCAVFLGNVDAAKSIYRKILKKHPKHQQTHYDLSQLAQARDDRHIKKMLKVLRKSSADPASNVYLFYALGKEYEDLGKWSDAFSYYEKAGEAVKTVAQYEVSEDVSLMENIVQTCSSAWLRDGPSTKTTKQTPIFIVGLPRTGTTLTDRILSSHSKVQGAGESQLLQMVLRDGSRAGNQIGITAAQIESASLRNPATIAAAYTDALMHRLGDEPYFTEKLPENVLYLGFIAKAWPNAKIIHLRRHPMDACFALFKQSYFRFAYSLDDLAAYYLAYDKLSRHWREVLGSRVLELDYEDLVSDQEVQTRRILDLLGLSFEDACLRFEENSAPVATASAVQVREKVHSRSVGKWKRFEKNLRPLRDRLQRGGISI